MASIMADHNVEGHFVVLLRLWTSDVWRTVWESLELEVESFERLWLPQTTLLAPYTTGECSVAHSARDQRAPAALEHGWRHGHHCL
jgi:hypothetical protein